MTSLTELDVAANQFEPIADALRVAVLARYRAAGMALSGPSGLRTLETNSGLAARRGNSLLAILALHEPDLALQDLSLVDIGCGFGSLAVYFAHLGASVTAIDVNSERLEVGESVARECGLDISWVHGSLQELPGPNGRFEIAVLNNSLCYVVPRPERLISLAHVRRVLCPGGWLLMRNPNRTALRDPFTGLPGLNRLPPRAAAAAAHGLGRHRSDVRLLSARGQRAELRRIGFEGIDVRSARQRTVKAFDRWVASYQHVLARRPWHG